jgi:nucleoside-diphosphate-sugar epimerase
MRVLVAGGTGAIGRQLVPLLVERGDDVFVVSRGRSELGWVEQAGARHVPADVLVEDQIAAAVKASAPAAVVDLLTALPDPIDPRHIDRDMVATNHLRTIGAGNLLSAAKAAGVGKIVGESVAFVYDPSGDRVNPEGAQLWQQPPARFAPARDAIVRHERAIRKAGGTVLRFGHLYGPGTSYARDGGAADQVRNRKFPIVGGGTGIFSFIHVIDAARAIDAALRVDGGPTVLNVVDDDPATLSEWLPVYAELLGAKAPSKVPALIGRLFAGGYGVAFLTKIRGASNVRAKEALGWAPIYASWRQGFASELAGDAPAVGSPAVPSAPRAA